MEWVIQQMRLVIGALSIDISRVSDVHWAVYAHLIAGTAPKSPRVCVAVDGPRGFAPTSLGEAQSAAHVFVEERGPIEPWLALFAFYGFDRERPTARRLATARASLRKERTKRVRRAA